MFQGIVAFVGIMVVLLRLLWDERTIRSLRAENEHLRLRLRSGQPDLPDSGEYAIYSESAGLPWVRSTDR